MADHVHIPTTMRSASSEVFARSIRSNSNRDTGRYMKTEREEGVLKL